MNYAQTFQLLPDGQGSYFVFNDIFRLIYNVSKNRIETCYKMKC